MRYQPRHRAPRAYHRRLVLLLTVATLVVLASVVGVVSQAQASVHKRDDGTPGCVSHDEWDAVKPVDVNHFMPVAWLRQTMNQHFGVVPYNVQGPYPFSDFLIGDGTGLTSSYHGCWKHPNGEYAIISVDFAKTNFVPFIQAYRSYDGIVF